MTEKKAPYTRFGKTRLLPVVVYLNNKQLKEVQEWDEELWIERPEDWYALMCDALKYKRVRVIENSEWVKAGDSLEEWRAKTPRGSLNSFGSRGLGLSQDGSLLEVI